MEFGHGSASRAPRRPRRLLDAPTTRSLAPCSSSPLFSTRISTGAPSGQRMSTITRLRASVSAWHANESRPPSVSTMFGALVHANICRRFCQRKHGHDGLILGELSRGLRRLSRSRRTWPTRQDDGSRRACLVPLCSWYRFVMDCDPSRVPLRIEPCRESWEIERTPHDSREGS